MTNEQAIAVIKKNPISFGCGVLCVALGLALYFRGGSLAEAEALLAEKSAEGERYAANIKYGAQLKEQLDEVTAANKEIAARVIRVGQLATNQQFFYKAESESGVKLSDYRQQTLTAPKGKTAFTPVAFTVSAQGDFKQLLDFMLILESGAHYSRVMSAAVSGSAVNRAAPLSLTLNLELLGVP